MKCLKDKRRMIGFVSMGLVFTLVSVNESQAGWKFWQKKMPPTYTSSSYTQRDAQDRIIPETTAPRDIDAEMEDSANIQVANKADKLASKKMAYEDALSKGGTWYSSSGPLAYKPAQKKVIANAYKEYVKANKEHVDAVMKRQAFIDKAAAKAKTFEEKQKAINDYKTSQAYKALLDRMTGEKKSVFGKLKSLFAKKKTSGKQQSKQIDESKEGIQMIDFANDALAQLSHISLNSDSASISDTVYSDASPWSGCYTPGSTCSTSESGFYTPMGGNTPVIKRARSARY